VDSRKLVRGPAANTDAYPREKLILRFKDQVRPPTRTVDRSGQAVGFF
jgi:hypothetical protein